MLSAIVIVEPERPEQDNREGDSRGISPAPVQGEPRIPLAFAEVLGQSVFARLIEELRRAGVGAISVYGSISAARARTDIDSATNVEFRWTKEPWTKATQRLLADGKKWRRTNIGCSRRRVRGSGSEGCTPLPPRTKTGPDARIRRKRAVRHLDSQSGLDLAGPGRSGGFQCGRAGQVSCARLRQST